MKPTKLVFFNYGTEYINEHTGTWRKNKYGQENDIHKIPEQDKKFVLNNINKLVLKPVNESGGYGILIGPNATKKELNDYKSKINLNPRNFVAQPLIKLSTSPTLIKTSIQPRHIDLRPFILSGNDTFITNGGLTRVALEKGSTIVNSSQGGGSKDTWVVN